MALYITDEACYLGCPCLTAFQLNLMLHAMVAIYQAQQLIVHMLNKLQVPQKVYKIMVVSPTGIH